jgi:hypothetical protein
VSVGVDLTVTNALIARFAYCHRQTMRAERRAGMKSALFDLPRRSSLGWAAVHEHGGALVAELRDAIDPYDLGRRMRRVGSRPYTLQAFMLACGYLAGRQQLLLDAGLAPGDGLPGEDPEEVAMVVGFWARLLEGQRDSDRLMPEEDGGATRVLDAADVQSVRALLRPQDDATRSRVRKMAATLELYGFILHGEQRDGIGGHGPYPLDDGSVMFFKEFNDLRNGDLPWAATDAENPYPYIVVATIARDVEVRCDLFGSMVVSPHELGDRVLAQATLTQGPDGLRVVDDEADDLREAAAAAQQELYVRAIGWDDRYKIAYGAPLFANHVAPLFALAGIDGVYPRIAARFEETAERLTDAMHEAPVPSMWQHYADGETPFYWPVPT